MYPPFQQPPPQQQQPPVQGYYAPAQYGYPVQTVPQQQLQPLIAQPHPVEKGRWKRVLPIVSMIMMIIGMILTASALNSSIYNIHASGNVWFISIEVDETLYYDHIDNQNSYATSNTTTYDEIKFYNVKDQVQQYYMLLAAGTVMMAVTMVLGIFVFFRKLGPVPIGVIGILAAIICLLGPVLLSAGLPGAVEADSKSSGNDLCSQYQGENTPCKSFTGESNVDTGLGPITMKWGPTNGFYTSIVGAVFAMIGAIIIFPSPRPAKKSSQLQQTAPVQPPSSPPQPYYSGPAAMPLQPTAMQSSPPIGTQTVGNHPPGEVPPEGPPPDLPQSMVPPQYGPPPQQQRPPPGPRTY